MTAANIQFHDLHPTRNEFIDDVLQGLRQTPACIPPKYFYDSRGSQLFDEITRLPEYYLARTEMAILRNNAEDIAARIGTGHLLVEPGGGSCEKVHILLEGLRPCAYVPMDISHQHLQMAAAELAIDYPWLEVHAACTDFTRDMQLPASLPPGRHVAFFPGSSIGNFKPAEAARFLHSVADLVGSDGYLLIGVDLKKDNATLEAAYNDRQGITAQFNLNLLQRINAELGGDFVIDQWQHRAFYNSEEGRIEMHLASTVEQSVRIGGERFLFKAGDSIHTENSYKYSADEFIRLAEQAGFHADRLWMDEQRLFSVHLFSVQA